MFNHTNKKIVFITAIYGDYESSCKPYVMQTIPTDFICFTNNNDIIYNNWDVDLHPYHHINPSKLDDGSYLNSISNNNHTFNIAKYYKQAFHNIPRLKSYDVVVWLDGTKEITNSETSEWIVNQIEINPIITWEHYTSKGSLKAEVDASMFYKYTSEFWFNQKQPYQDVQAQYRDYIQDGYDEGLWAKIEPGRKNLGVWNTGFIVFDNKNDKVHEFLDLWYLQTLKYSTQDQVSFPYVVQKLGLYPYTLPDASIKGNSDGNYLFVKHYHNDQQFLHKLFEGKDPSHAILYLATIDNYIHQVRDLLESRKDFRLEAENSLHAAVLRNHYEISKMILEYGVDINKIHSGATVLYWSAQKEHDKIVQILLEFGADTEIKSTANMTPLMISIQKHNFMITKLLLESGANIEGFSNGVTPLFSAAYFGYKDIIELLLYHGANKNIQVNEVSVFQIALKNNHQSTAQLLAGGEKEFCKQIQNTEFEIKYAEICGEVRIEVLIED